MDVPVMEAYTTKAILGGMTMAMELAVAIKAVENGAEKPPLSTIAGIRTAPNAATVAGPEPAFPLVICSWLVLSQVSLWDLP